MCGINGIFFYKSGKEVDARELERARDTLAHRGPDGAGLYVSKNKKLGFGHRRLSIIDLSEAGKQPMTNERGSVWITFNGEIYNFKELKAELENKGHIFHSLTDTEVIVHGYEEFGFDFVKRLNGMFAFAIWDETKKILFAARDHMGIKPFYYAMQNGVFYFGSELKAILEFRDFKKELDEAGVSHYLTFSTSPAPGTLFRNIYKLPPASVLAIKQGGEPEISEYWNPVCPEDKTIGENEAARRVRELLEASIHLQMVSDVPFGCFLSGGIDSSTNASLMSRALGKPVETFSVGAKHFSKYNEFDYSRVMAKQLGANSHEILIDESHLFEFMEKFGKIADDPNGDQVCIPLYWLSKLTRDSGVKMVQIGEGSDEIFFGYDTYIKAFKLYNRLWRFLERLPAAGKQILCSTGETFLKHPKFEFYKEYLRRLAENEEPYWGNAVAWSTYQKEKLLTAEFKEKHGSNSYGIIERLHNEMKKRDSNSDFLRRLLFVELKHRLPELLLTRADKMTMANSIEGRVPFLDRRLVEFAFQIPSGLKIKNGIPKYILKKAVHGVIPENIIWRKKQGFAAPLSEWLRPDSPTVSKLVSIIENSGLRERNIINYDYVRWIINSHQRNGVNQNFRIWNLVTLSLWYDAWF